MPRGDVVCMRRTAFGWVLNKGTKGHRVRTSRAVLICLLAFCGWAQAQTNFFIQGIQRNPNTSVTINWPVTPSWTYHVMYSGSPTGTWLDFPDGQLTAGSNAVALQYTDTLTGASSQRFYKLRVNRSPVIVTLVLDHAGVMNPASPGSTMGGPYLAGAVTNFINDFSDNFDQVAMVSFASTPNVDVPMTNVFRRAILSAATNLFYAGGAFAAGGLTNGLIQSASAVATTQGETRVVVFFTDELANMIEDVFSCTNPTTWYYGAADAGNFVFFFNADTPNTALAQTNGFSCFLGDSGAPTGCGCSTNSFFSLQYWMPEAFIRSNVTAEAQYRAITTANLIRAQGTYVYAIGLQGAGPIAGVTTNYLQQLANDPGSPTYDPTQPTGQALIASSPAQLNQLFQSIASQIQVY